MAKKQEDQSRKIVLKRGLGETPEDPVCDSGIFCYGKPLFVIYDVKLIFIQIINEIKLGKKG